MKKTVFIIGLALVVIFAYTAAGQSQSDRGHGYGMGPGMMGGSIDVPAKLPTPKNTEWVQQLKAIFALEKQSLTQYQIDQEKFNAYMPYMMVIPQEEDHIAWIEQLFKAYGLPADGKAAPVVDNKTLADAYGLSAKMENDLITRYEWLVKNAEDRDTAQVLNTILLQSRWHLVMFEHALRMGHGYGYSRGSGMMGGYGMGPGMMGGYGMGPGMMGGYGTGSGMMGGYGMGPGRGYGRQPTGKAIDAKEAEAMMKDYLKSSRNPNLKLGKIKDVGYAFEAEILTKKNDLVDRVQIDKTTGYIRSAY
ncbi:MAG: putative exported protein [Deltaproteobacteria bacterium]|nr:putative exported protein [Deltaproteobacteria bacterium]